MKVLILGSATSNGLRALKLGNQIYGGGWVENLVNECSQNYDLQLFVAFFHSNLETIKKACVNNVTYVGLPTDDPKLNKTTKLMKRSLLSLVEMVKPDITHIIGTERRFNYELFKLVGSKRTIVSLTGLVSVYQRHYLGQVEEKYFYFRSIGDILRGNGPIQEQRLFKRFGKIETKLIKEVKHCMGRTTWDYACVKHINPDINYIHCGEILNDCFYSNQWDFDNCDKHSIFVSQGGYPLKGLHYLFESFPIIMERFPDAKIVIAGPNIWKSDSFISRLKQTTYSKFLAKIRKKFNIPLEKIMFTGPLDANRMKECYLKSNVFVMPSIIENSPNSLGEAMLLGMPCVASYVGGIPDMAIHGENAYLYPADEPYMLAYFITTVFENSAKAIAMGQKAREYALKRFDKKEICSITINAYKKIYNQNIKDSND